MSLQFQPLDSSVLTAEEMDEARTRARRQLADEIAKTELGLTNKTVAAIKGPLPVADEEQFTITLDLYEGAHHIKLDNQTFFHGHTYTVGKRTYDSLREVVARGWAHQREIEGKDSNAYRKEQNMIVKGNDRITTRSLKNDRA